MNTIYNSLSYRQNSKFILQEPEIVGNAPNLSGKKRTSWLMSLMMIASMLLVNNSWSQVASYGFSQSSGTYTAITGGTVPTLTGNPGAWDDGVSNAANNIGFTFVFNNIAYTQCAISTNGALSFGATAVAGTNYSVISSTAGYAGAIAAWSRDIQGSTVAMSGFNGEIRYQTTGTTPNRVFTVQWKDGRRYNGTTVNTERLEMQVQLFETSNQIKIVYGTWSNAISATTTNVGQVGLRGATNADRKNLEVLSGGNWATPTAGTTTTQTCFYNQSSVATKPASGLTYTFTPPAVLTPPNCATGLTPLAAATNVQRNLTLSWTSTPSATSYDVHFGISANPPLVVNQVATTYTPAILAANTQYFWKIVPRNANGPAVGCVEQSFTTGPNIVYCAPTYTNGPGTIDGISNVTLGTLSNSTGNSTTPYYTFYNAVTIPNVQQGSTPTVSITYGSDPNQFGAVWIDFNQNGTFDASEGFVSTNAGASGTSVITITVPPGATLGNTRMRVRGGDDSALTTAQACGASSSSFGETEDYIVNIITPPTDTPDYVNLQFPASASVLAGNSATVFARVYEGGLTDITSGQAPGIEAWIGISPAGATASSNPNTWTTWIPATFNVETDGNNNDEYQANIGSTLAVGTYRYASRFRLNGGPFVYGGNPFNAWNGTDSNSGVLTVNANPTQCATLVAPANAATNVTRGTVALSWTAPTSGPAPTGYKVFFGTTTNPTTLVATVTTLTYNATAPAYSTTYYWRIVPTSTVGGDAVGCSEFSFTTQADPFLPYCSGMTFTSAVEPISSVNFAGIANTSPAALNGGPAHENFISITGAVTAGSSYPMVLKGNTDGNFTNNFRVFIDWNQDGDFVDAGELFNAGTITNSTGVDPIQASSTIAVPANATPGTTRMRVKKLFGLTNIDNPCLGGAFGQFEDYSLTVNLTWYADTDNDGFGNPASFITAVTNPGGYVLDNTDCDDTQTFYTDLDNDGFGVLPKLACGTVTNNTDCDDAVTYYTDLDNDGFGALPKLACGTVTNNTDCNDNQIQYFDGDSDGYGTAVQVACGVVLTGDCNDTNSAINPGAVDVCFDGIDNDCNGIIDNVGQPGGCVPIITVVQGSQCGSTLATIDQYIYANLVSGAQGYRFRVTDLTTNQVQTIDKALRVFQLTQLTNYAFNRTYQVEVSVRKFNVWQPFYGAPCTLTTPATTTQVRAIQCGSTLTAMSNVIYADNVPFASGYRFRVVNTLTSNTQVLDRTLREFRMNLLTSPEYNTLYTVEVAIRNTDGTYLPYGPICNLTTPEFPTTFLQNSQCDYTAVSNNETFYAVSYPGATTYRFRFINTALSYSYTFDKVLRTFNLSEVPGLQPATTYAVQVSIELNGEFGPYGKVCSLTTPGTVAITRTTEKVVPFTAVAYPNPYAESFNLNVTTSSDANITITVYDMIGKQIEVRQVSASAINTIQIGDSYPSGVYNVIVTQGETSQNVRVIKR